MPVWADANQRDACALGIERAGFNIEEPYRYEESGFFSLASHIFGVFTCEVNSDGTVHKILRGQSIIAEDGIYGIQALKIWELIEASAEDRRDEAREQRDAAINSARERYENISIGIDGLNTLALNTLQKGELHEIALKDLGFTEAEITTFNADLGLKIGSSSDEIETPERAEARRAEEVRHAEIKKAEEANERAEKLAENRERAERTFPIAMKAATAGNFAHVRALASKAMGLRAWSDQQLKQLEQAVYAQVRPLPASQTPQNLDGYETLALLAPDNPKYIQSVKKYRDQSVEDLARERREREVANGRAAEDRFVWIASRLSGNNSEAQRQYAFEQVENKLVVAIGRVSDVERAGIISPPTITIDAGYDGLTVFCHLPRSTTDGALATVSKGQRYECRGTASSYTFIFGSAGISVTAKSIR